MSLAEFGDLVWILAFLSCAISALVMRYEYKEEIEDAGPAAGQRMRDAEFLAQINKRRD